MEIERATFRYEGIHGSSQNKVITVHKHHRTYHDDGSITVEKNPRWEFYHKRATQGMSGWKKIRDEEPLIVDDERVK